MLRHLLIRLVRPAASQWRRFMVAEVRRDLAKLDSVQSEILRLVSGTSEHIGSNASPPAVMDINVLLHQSRSALLRSIPQGAEIFLSVGCAGGWYFDWIERCYGRPRRHIGIEYYADRPPLLPDNVTWIANSASDMSELERESCDLLFSGQNIEHLWPDEVVGFLIEAARVLHAGGHLVVDSPNRVLTAALNWSHPEHTVEFTLEEISRLVFLAGFDVTRISGIWLCRDPANGRILPFNPNGEDPGWSVAERLICALDAPAHSFIWWLEASRSTRSVDASGLRTTMQSIFETAWPERTRRMVVGIGQIERRKDDDWVVCPRGQSGAVLSGPSMPLRAGRYRCTFRLDCPGGPSDAPVARCEVNVSNIDTAVAQQDVVPEIRAVKDVSIEFELRQVAFGVQFRCISYGTASFACRREVALMTVNGR
jgi:SAM-dependent methyltransferase